MKPKVKPPPIQKKAMMSGSRVLAVIDRYAIHNPLAVAVYLLVNLAWMYAMPPFSEHRVAVSLGSTYCLMASIFLMKYLWSGFFWFLIYWWSQYQAAVGGLIIADIVGRCVHCGVPHFFYFWDTFLGTMLATIVYILALLVSIIALIVLVKNIRKTTQPLSIRLGNYYLLSALFPAARLVAVFFKNLDTEASVTATDILYWMFPFDGFPYSGQTFYLISFLASVGIAVSLFFITWIPSQRRLLWTTVFAGVLVGFESFSPLIFIQWLLGWIETGRPFIDLLFILLHIENFIWLLVHYIKTRRSPSQN